MLTYNAGDFSLFQGLVPPSLQTPKATDLLIRQSNGMRYRPHIKAGNISEKKIIKHCGVTAIFEFFFERFKICVVALLNWRDIKNEEPALIGAGRDNPVII